jgi:phenylacetate-CoA ligase
MKRALSRKNLWESLPRWVRAGSGTVLGLARPEWLLGKSFRKQMRFLEEAQWWSAERSREYQLASLRRICELAYGRTDYYHRVFDAAGFHPKDLKRPEDISGLPFLDRSALRDHLAEMCTVPPTSPGIDLISTGGTSGKPVHFYAGSGRSATEYAYLASGWARAGYRLGQPLAVFRGRVVPPDATGLRHEYDGLLKHHYYSNFHMNDATMRRYVEHLRGVGSCYLHVYPSSAAALARFIRGSGVEPPAGVSGILVESEIVYPDQRRTVEEVFGKRYYSSYGMTEKVVAAAECEASTAYHVWPTYGYFELIDESGCQVTTPGGRGEIVGTGFINDVVPMLRYRTGDYATFVASRCDACGREHQVIADIRGHRVQETLVAADGARISWTSLNMHDDTFLRVLRFQFLQEAPGSARLRVVPGEGFGEADRARLQRNLGRKLDGRLEVSLEVVDSIPLSPGGKAIYVDQRLPDTGP